MLSLAGIPGLAYLPDEARTNMAPQRNLRRPTIEPKDYKQTDQQRIWNEAVDQKNEAKRLRKARRKP